MDFANSRFSRLSSIGFLLIVVVLSPLSAYDGATGFRSPDEVMDTWSRAVRNQDIELFTTCYWSDARQLHVTADGERQRLSGVDDIAGTFEYLLSLHVTDTSGFWLPVPLSYTNPENGARQFIYRDRSYPAINMVEFEERDGVVAISAQHLYWRNLLEYVPGAEQRVYDSNRDGVLSPSEQNVMVEAYWLVTTGRHGVLNPLDEFFDFDGDRYISDAESRRARSAILRDRLRRLPGVYPAFAEQYLNTTAAGEVTIHTANSILRDFIDSETAIRPMEVTPGSRYAVADFNEDGWVGFDEIYAYAEMIVRVLSAVPEPFCFSAETDGSTEEIVLWTDGNSDGVISDNELNDLGYLVFAALGGDPIIASAPLCRFDQDRDFALSGAEKDALRAYFAIELLPQTVTHLSDIYPTISLLDTDNSGDLSRIEIGSVMDLITGPGREVGTRVNSPLDEAIDRSPANGRLSEWEVWSVVEAVLASSSRRWIESRVGGDGIVQFERQSGAVAGGDGEEGDETALALRSATAPSVREEFGVIQRLLRSRPAESLTMPDLTVSDGTVEIGASLDPVFPVLYKWYADEHIGQVYVRNAADEPVADLVARVRIPRHVDSPIDSGKLDSVAAGEIATIDLPALFDEAAVLAITEGRTAAATVEVEYTIGESRESLEQTLQIDFYDRNAVTWDDDRKAAAFVTARDDQVLLFSGNLNASMYTQFRTGLSRELQLAMLLFDGLAEHGMVYRSDPSSPYSDFSQDEFAVDYLQFPRQTLAFRNGDCDDLSVCYAALLEAAGTPAAFVTTPGHIFVAVQLSTSEDEARRTYLFPEDLIYLDATVWLPVEITALRGSFLEAWSVGARQWREAAATDDARLIPVREAWQEYSPVGLSGFTFPLSAPDSPRVVDRCNTELTQFVAREIADREARFQERLAGEPGNHELRNRLGTLYARYGLMDRANEQYALIVDEAEFYPALLNLGNTSYLAGEFEDALGYYERALEAQPESGPAILGIARSSLEVEDYPRVRTAYDRLKDVSPALASEHSYLESRRSGSSRAGTAGLTPTGTPLPVVWIDEVE